MAAAVPVGGLLWLLCGCALASVAAPLRGSTSRAARILEVAAHFRRGTDGAGQKLCASLRRDTERAASKIVGSCVLEARNRQGCQTTPAPLTGHAHRTKNVFDVLALDHLFVLARTHTDFRDDGA